MGNRSRFIVSGMIVGTAAVSLARRARRERLRGAFDGIQETISPLRAPPTAEVGELADEAHAPGHQHVTPPPSDEETRRAWRPLPRPFAKHNHGLRHPGPRKPRA